MNKLKWFKFKGMTQQKLGQTRTEHGALKQPLTTVWHEIVDLYLCYLFYELRLLTNPALTPTWRQWASTIALTFKHDWRFFRERK